MRIVGLFTEVFKVGGIQRLSRHVCLALSQFAQREGHRVSFLSLMDDPDDVDGCYLEGDAAFRGFRGNKVAFVAAALRELEHRPDVVYVAHINMTPVGLIMQLLGPSLRYGVALYGIEAWERLSLLGRYALQRASFIISISTYTSDQALKLQGLNPEKVHLVPPALDPFWGLASKKLFAAQLDPDLPQGRILLTVTRLTTHDKYKGVDCVIQAMHTVIERVPDVYYVVVGTGDDQERLQSLAERGGVRERVKFVGNLPEAALRACYDRCDVFVMPSKKEGFGIVFLEAMFYKKAVIGGKHAGILDVVEDRKTGILVRYGDIEGLSEAITELLRNDERRLRMGEMGYLRLKSNFTYERFRDKLVNVFESQLRQ